MDMRLQYSFWTKERLYNEDRDSYGRDGQSFR